MDRSPGLSDRRDDRHGAGQVAVLDANLALVHEHSALAEVIAPGGELPSVYACYRFTAKLRQYDHLLQDCIARVVRRIKDRDPEFGKDVAIDASDMPAYANGQRFKGVKIRRERTPEEYSDPDAS
jgi:hypothetical protein